jgi:XTP/dITP diphosphohydrolase
MLAELEGVPAERRTARYRCVIAMVSAADDRHPLIATGSWEGRVLEAPRGEGGFGYDPIFLPRGCERTAAELTAQEKNQLSHRAQALRELVSLLCRN